MHRVIDPPNQALILTTFVSPILKVKNLIPCKINSIVTRYQAQQFRFYYHRLNQFRFILQAEQFTACTIILKVRHFIPVKRDSLGLCCLRQMSRKDNSNTSPMLFHKDHRSLENISSSNYYSNIQILEKSQMK
jgi:hypothetical protein